MTEPLISFFSVKARGAENAGMVTWEGVRLFPGSQIKSEGARGRRMNPTAGTP